MYGEGETHDYCHVNVLSWWNKSLDMRDYSAVLSLQVLFLNLDNLKYVDFHAYSVPTLRVISVDIVLKYLLFFLPFDKIDFSI